MLIKAVIEVLDREAIDLGRGVLPVMPVQFNPTEYTLDKGAQIAEIGIPGLDSPILQFVRGQTETLSLELFYDTTGLGMDEAGVDVRTLTEPIYQLVKLQPRTHAPPRIRFTWGLGLSFTAIVESVQQRFTLFNPLGVPLRAVLTLAFREYKTLEDQLAELNLQSSDQTRRRVTALGETLSDIAAQEYGDPAEWRRLADANPEATATVRRLAPGTVLAVPPTDALGEPVLGST